MKRIFVDMNGTLAKFHSEVNYLERMYEKDFFRNLKPYENMVEAVKQLAQNPNYEVFILSAAVEGEPPYCKAEKHRWIDEHLSCIPKENRLFTKIGVPKASYIPDGVTKDDILIDDYNKGLDEWQLAGGTAVKCKNDINHKGLIGPLWQGALIDNQTPAEQIIKDLEQQIFPRYIAQKRNR